jgi:acetoacetyl-CoA reductase
MIAIVTGASRGIGLEISRALAKSGYTIIGLCRDAALDRDDLWSTSNKLFSLDVSDHSLVTNFFEKHAQLINDVDVLVNNAGVTRDAFFHKMSYEEWSAVIDINLKSLFSITQPVYRKMIKRGSGRIVNISSVNAQKGQAGQVNYCASKAGVHGFTKALALEAARNNITVNTVSPGYTKTAMLASIREDIREQIEQGIPMKRFAVPEDIAQAVCYLVSKEAAYVTGLNLSINGGLFIG